MAIDEVEKKLGQKNAKYRIAQLILDNYDQIDKEDRYSLGEAILEVVRLRDEGDQLAKEAQLLILQRKAFPAETS